MDKEKELLFMVHYEKNPLMRIEIGFPQEVLQSRSLAREIMKGEISGKAKNVLAYIGMPWNSQGMEFCKNCNMTFNVILPDPIFFLKEEPILEDVKVVNNYVR